MALPIVACRLGFNDATATSVRVSVSTVPPLTLVELDARLGFTSLDPGELYAIPAAGGVPALPEDIIFPLPAVAGALTVTLTARDASGRTVVGSGTAQVVPAEQQVVAIELGADLPAGCFDGAKDGDESDVDCGGSCPGCNPGGTCAKPADCATTTCVIGTCELASGPPVWLPVASLPDGRIGMGAGLAPDGQIYAFGGGPDDSIYTGEVDAYDSVADTWSIAPSLSTPRNRLGGAVGGDGALYAIGGTTAAGPVATVERYAPGSTSWVSIAALPIARLALAAVTGPDGTVYAVGGDTRVAVVANLEAYTGTSWLERAAMPTPRANLAAALDADGRLLAIGGHNETETIHYTTVEAYDPSTNTWTTLPALAHARSDLAAALGGDGRTYAISGYTGAAAVTFVEAYRPGAPRWVDTAPVQTARDTGAAAVGPDGRIFAFGGRAGPSVEAYGPRIRIAAQDGAVGDSIAIGGDNFAARATVRVYLDAIPVEVTTTDTSGVVSLGAVFHVPGVAPGPHVVRAIDDRSRYAVTIPFTVR